MRLALKLSYFLFLAYALISLPAEAAPKTDQASVYQVGLLSHAHVTQEFIQEIDFTLPDSTQNDPNLSIVYGEPTIGFFESRYYKKQGTTLSVKFVPTTYKSPITFYAQSAGKLYRLGEKSFSHPNPPILQDVQMTLEGQMSAPFFLVGGVFFPKSEKVRNNDRSYYAMIVNKLGEVVWCYLPDRGRRNIRKYPTIKPIGNGLYGIMFGEKWSYFETFDFLGRMLHRVNPKEAIDPYVIHHDFVHQYGSDTMLALDIKLTIVNNFFSLTHEEFSPWSLFQKPLSYLSTTLVEINLATNAQKVLWGSDGPLQPI